MHHFVTHNEETKVSIVERFNRTLKTRMWRYFTKTQSVRYVDVLQGFMRSYNDTYHRSIGIATSAVTSTNQETINFGNNCMVTTASAHLSSELAIVYA